MPIFARKLKRMKINKSTIWSFVLLVIIASLYRVIPSRPGGFAPQIAMALFAGSIIKEKQYAFLLPLLSMFVSDALYEVLYRNGLTQIAGFYSGQITNYILIASLTIIGFWVKKTNVTHIIAGSLAGTTLYFLASNFLVWLNGGLTYAKTWAGLTECYVAGLPFYRNSIYATLLFGGLLFGVYNLMIKSSTKQVVA
jgi:hypothetical protein